MGHFLVDKGNDEVWNVLETENFRLVLIEAEFPLRTYKGNRSLVRQETGNARTSKYSKKHSLW